MFCCQNRKPRCATSNTLSINAITQNDHIDKVAPRASSLTSKATSANNTSSSLGRCTGVFKACHNTENEEEEKQKTYCPTIAKRKPYSSISDKEKKPSFPLGGFTKNCYAMLDVRESWKLVDHIKKNTPKARTLNPLKHEKSISKPRAVRSMERKNTIKTFCSFFWISRVSAAR